MTSSPKVSKSPTSLQAFIPHALILVGGAVIWGCCMVHVALHPGASGEFGGLSVLFAAVVDMPLGLVSLVVALAVKKGHPALRWTCLVLSVAALALPFVTKAAWRRQFIPIK